MWNAALKSAANTIFLRRLADQSYAGLDHQWYDRGRLRNVLHFPIILSDLARTLVLGGLASIYLSVVATALISVANVLVAALQGWVNRAAARSDCDTSRTLRWVGSIALVRSLAGFGSLAVLSPFLPSELLVAALMGGTGILVLESISLLAIPKTAMVQFVSGATLLLTGTGLRTDVSHPAIAFVLVTMIPWTYWAVFNLHYLFATRRLRTRSLSQTAETVQLLLNQYDEDASDWLFECDADGLIHNPSKRFCAAAGKSLDELAGTRFSSLFEESPERDELRQLGDRFEPFHGLMLSLFVNGSRCWWQISARPTFDGKDRWNGWRGFVADKTATKRAEDQVRHMAHHDVLTNLPNRSSFAKCLEHAFQSSKPDKTIAVLYIDLDRFKAINDTYGHRIGDEVLIEAARRISSTVPPGALVARLGGDEFAVIIRPVSGREQAEHIASTIVFAMNQPIHIGRETMFIGASVGVALAPHDGGSGEGLLVAADLALYDVKGKGRNGFTSFDPVMLDRAHQRRAFELDLHTAISEGQLELRYQPFVNISTGETVGYEALLRWHHPLHGMVPPSLFIPVAEETGQIVAIGAWVIRTALQEASNWEESISISINLSPAQMRGGELLPTIVTALAASGVCPTRVEIEITETFLMAENEENVRTLRAIKDLGIRIALDDFGTGYSSLSYLRSFPFDRIKIDQCFIRGIDDRSDNLAIVEAIVSLARSLNMRTTAEGVETLAQLAEIRDRGCHEAQGFLFSDGVAASSLPKKTRSNEPIVLTDTSSNKNRRLKVA